MSSLNLVRWGGVAAVLLFIGTVLNTQDSSLVPLFIIPGLLALLGGFVLLSVAVLRARCCRAGRPYCS